ncbi:MAG: NAD(P)/FAD-dependent oxidoreductase [Candidatus Micrarchaeia archaeon]
MQDFDVVIVGGAVSGSKVAQLCANARLKVAVLEEHPIAGKYGRCTAIISKRGLDSIDADYSSSSLNRIFGADIDAAGAKLSVETSRVQALVLDRFAFDAACANSAKKAGAKFFFNTRFESFSVQKKGSGECYEITARSLLAKKTRKFRCKVLVGADGANSAVAKAACFPALSKKDYAFCYEAEYCKATVPNLRRVQVFLDAKGLSGFFGWSVPVSKSVIRIGLGTTRRHTLLESKKAFFLRPEIKSMLSPDSKMVREFYAMIPIRPRKRTQLGSILLVGDSAGQVKASTGGGVVFSCRCANVAAGEIVSFLQHGVPMEYERKWKRQYGRTLVAHRKIRSFLDVLGNRRMAFLLSFGKILGLGVFLERFGDMDDIISA